MTPKPNDILRARPQVVVVGVNFEPEVSGIGPYTTLLCEHLRDAGAAVQVITGMPHYPAWSVDPAYRRKWRVREEHRGFPLTRVRHYVPASQTMTKRALFELSFALAARTQGRGVTADAVIAVTPNLGSLPVAAAIARTNRAPLGVVVQDLIGRAAGESGIKGSPGLARAAKRTESRWLRRADLVGVISEAFIRPLVADGLGESKIVLLRNPSRIDPDHRSPKLARKELGWLEPGFCVVHTGNIGLKQNLENVAEAARLAEQRSLPVQFVIIGDGSQRRILEIKVAGLSHCRLLPPLPQQTYPVALAAADALLVNERPTVKDMSLPSKLTSYLASGRPIIGSVAEHGATAAELRRTNAALIAQPGDPEALLDAALRLARDPDLCARLGEAGRAYALEHLTESAARRRTAQFLEDLLAKR